MPPGPNFFGSVTLNSGAGGGVGSKMAVIIAGVKFNTIVNKGGRQGWPAALNELQLSLG